MNEELKKIINYVIDNGSKRLDWCEDEVSCIQWKIKSGYWELWFEVDIFTSEHVYYYLTLFEGDKVSGIKFNDYIGLDYENRDELLDRIRELGVL